jgi:hypothetical protein
VCVCVFHRHSCTRRCQAVPADDSVQSAPPLGHALQSIASPPSPPSTANSLSAQRLYVQLNTLASPLVPFSTARACSVYAAGVGSDAVYSHAAALHCDAHALAFTAKRHGSCHDPTSPARPSSRTGNVNADSCCGDRPPAAPAVPPPHTAEKPNVGACSALMFAGARVTFTVGAALSTRQLNAVTTPLHRRSRSTANSRNKMRRIGHQTR